MWCERGRKRAANQVRFFQVTNSIETPTPTSDSPVTASTTRFMEPSDGVKSNGTELPFLGDFLTNNPQVTRRPVHARGGSSVSGPLSRAALT